MSPAVQTFVAVVLGAVLATIGGFAATQLGIWIDRSRRARSAGLLCGETLAGVGTLLRLAEEAAVTNSFFDELRFRFLRAARREIEVYDRNRELMFSLGDADLRGRLHSFMVRLSIPLDRLADGYAKYIQLSDGHLDTEKLREEMEEVFSFLVESRAHIPEFLALLQPVARNGFASYSHIDNDGIPVAS